MLDTKVHFHNLDILRLICALAVALAHSYEAYFSWIGVPFFLQNNAWLKPILDVFVGNMALGVTMFFIISGFLITYLLLLEKQNFKNINVLKFIIRRSLRIWPLYYLAIILGYFLVVYAKYPHPNYVANVFFLNNFNAIKTLQWQFPFAHFWSICVEEHFYLVWPLILFFLPIKRVWIGALLLILLSIGFRYYCTITIGSEYLQHNLYLHTLSRVDEILVGAVIACIHFFKPIQINISIWVRLLVYAALLFFICIQPQSDYWVWGIYSVLYKKYIYLAGISFWMLNYLFNPQALFNFKQKNVLHYLGKISFGIYIYHNMIIPVYITRFVYVFNAKNFALYFLCYFIFLIIISIISFEVYEKYFLKMKERFALIKTQR